MQIVKSMLEEEFLVIDVIDTGIGIKAQDQEKLFKLFGFVQDSKQMNTNGIGLGLVISDQIINKLGGKISFNSTENVGSTFRFEVKLNLDQEKSNSRPERPLAKINHNRSINQESSFVDNHMSIQSRPPSNINDSICIESSEPPKALSYNKDSKSGSNSGTTTQKIKKLLEFKDSYRSDMSVVMSEANKDDQGIGK